MRVGAAAFAAVALVLAAGVGARADTGAGNLGPEAKLLVDAWLAAQNKGDFAAFEKLCAAKFTGVRRWARARCRSIAKAGGRPRPHVPKADEGERQRRRRSAPHRPRRASRSCRSSSRAAITTAGRKQLVVVREAGVARIAQEEMIASEKSGATSPAAGSFALVIGKYAILDPDAGDEFATGAARVDDDGNPLVTSKRASGLPPELAAYAGKKLIVQSAGAEPCTATVKEVRVVGVVVPHLARARTGATRRRARASRRKRRGASPPRCSAPCSTVARPRSRPSPARRRPGIELVARRKNDPARGGDRGAAQPAVVARAAEGVRERRRQGQMGRHRQRRRGRRRALGAAWKAARHRQRARLRWLWRLWRRGLRRLRPQARRHAHPRRRAAGAAPDGARSSSTVSPPSSAPSRWTDFGTALQIVPLKGEARKIEVPYLDCPC